VGLPAPAAAPGARLDGPARGSAGTGAPGVAGRGSLHEAAGGHRGAGGAALDAGGGGGRAAAGRGAC
jgi:hypothetical protein